MSAPEPAELSPADLLRTIPEQTVIAAYETANRRHIEAVALLEYRCRRKGCLLLHVWKSPAGLLFYRPRYKFSPTLNERSSNAAGRARNTEDGDRRWEAQAGSIEGLRGLQHPAAGMPLTCDHIHLTELATKLFNAADAATPGRPTRRMI